ncbi:MAG TPA: DUF4142 domain-containing protein [Gemmatimonadaceae bacterium]
MSVNLPRIHSRAGGMALAVAVAASLGACSPRNDTAARADSAAADLGERAGAAVDTAAAAGAVAVDTMSNRMTGAMNNADWGDADILAYLVAADSGEIAAGKLASSKATSAPVKAFAQKMVSDHQKMLKEATKFASSQNISVASASNGDIQELRNDSRDALGDLTNKAAGADWDEDYVDKQVDAHQDVIDHVNDFTKATQNAQLRTMLQQALPSLQSHLKAAQDLQSSKLAS